MPREINFKSILSFTLPMIATMLFLSLYTIVDGAIVANLINEKALSAINIVLPLVMVVVSVGMMVGTGGNAICAKLLGEGKRMESCQNLSQFVVFSFGVGLIITISTLIFIEPILALLGADSETWEYAIKYAITYISFVPFIVLQIVFQNVLVTAGKAILSFLAILIGGITNIILDFVFMGIAGAGIATGIGNTLGMMIGLIFFSVKREKKMIAFTRPKFSGRIILKMCGNGSSEMVTNLSVSVITFLFNITMLELIGNEGVAAITVVLYAEMFVSSILMGYSFGVSPVISYNYGQKNKENLRKIFKISLRVILVIAALMFAVAIFISPIISDFFLVKNSDAYLLSVHGMKLFSLSFLFSGFNTFSSAMFTAFSNGKVSALISFLRTFLFIIAALMILPKQIGVDGVWLAVPIAEILSLFIAIFFLKKYKEEYFYN